jgi:prepilin-type N-terminal cleavage/methylation domain-containing protein
LSRQPDPDSACADDGFTLIEALAALTVAVIGLGALAELTHATTRSATFAERRVELIETARKALAGLPARDGISEGEMQGDLNGKGWRLSVVPYVGGPSQSRGGGWRPERVTIEVRAAHGARLDLETVRLVRGSAP